MTTIKLLLNSVVSSIGAKVMTADVKHFYLNTPMDEPEHMKLPVRIIPDEIKLEYKVSEFKHAGYVYIQVNKGIYGLAQAGMLANELWQKGWRNTDSMKCHTLQAYVDITKIPSNSR